MWKTFTFTWNWYIEKLNWWIWNDWQINIGNFTRKTHFSFSNFTVYEHYIEAIDQGYDFDDAILNGYIYMLNTIQFNSVHRSRYGNSSDFNREITEFWGKDCFIPTKRFCFTKRNKQITGQVYKAEYLDFSRNEKRRCNKMTMARTQPFCRFSSNSLGYIDGIGVFPRLVTERYKALYLYNIRFCLL